MFISEQTQHDLLLVIVSMIFILFVTGVAAQIAPLTVIPPA